MWTVKAVEYPKKVAVIHCHGHQKGQDSVTKGNRRADRTAKDAAMKTVVMGPLVIPQCNLPEYKIDPSEKEKFIAQGAIETEGRFEMP